MPGLLLEEGIVFLAEADCHEVVELLEGPLRVYPHPDSPGASWTMIRPHSEHQGRPGSTGFTHAALEPHTDRSMAAVPPAILCFLILREAADGGDSILIDTKPLLIRYGLPSLRNIENDLWLAGHLQGQRQRVLEISGSGAVVVRYRDDEVARPRADSRLSESLLCDLRNAWKSAAGVRLSAGQGYLIHNHRFLHGRTSFTGPRKGARILFHADGDSPFATLNSGFAIEPDGDGRENGRQ